MLAGNCSPIFESCSFDYNRAGATGDSANARGGALRIGCNPNAAGHTNGTTIVNCLFEANQASIEGGAVYLDCTPPGGGSNNVIVDNCTFVKNKAEDAATATYGGGLTQALGTATITNCIFWGNTDTDGTATVEQAQIYVKPSTGSAAVTYTDIDCGTTGLALYTDASNMNDDPDFENYAERDYHLDDDSLCLHTGSNAAIPGGITTDLDGNARIVHDTVDMGAYEFLASISGAVSCADHGTGPTEYCLDIDGGQHLDSRAGSGAKIVLDMDLNVDADSATARVSCVNNTYTGTVTLADDGGDASLLVITLDPALPDQDCCRIDLAGPSKDVQDVAILRGDANRDGDVTSLDYSAVKLYLDLGAPVSDSNCHVDVDANEDINSLDYSYIKLRLGHQAPDCS